LEQTAKKLNELKKGSKTKKLFLYLEHLSFKIKEQNNSEYLKSKFKGMIKNGRDAFKNIKNKLSNIFMKKKSNKNEEYSFKVKIDGKELIIPKTGILLDPEYFNNENYIEIGKLKTFGEKMNKIENFNSEELE